MNFFCRRRALPRDYGQTACKKETLMDRYADATNELPVRSAAARPSPVGMVSGGAEQQVGTLEGILRMLSSLWRRNPPKMA